MVEETLVGIKALNQLKNRGRKSKYEALFTKYEKRITCFIKKCNESKIVTDEKKNELNKKFKTLMG